MSPLLVFNRLYRLEIQSVMLVFSTPLVNCCPSTFSLTSPTPSPLPKINLENTDLRRWIDAWIQTVWCVQLCCRPYSAGVWLTLCVWPDSEPTKLLHHPKQKHQKRRHLGIGVFIVPSSMCLWPCGSPDQGSRCRHVQTRGIPAESAWSLTNEQRGKNIDRA